MKDLKIKKLLEKSYIFLSLIMFLITSTKVLTQEKVKTVPATDLTQKVRTILRANPDTKYNWTLVGTNSKAESQEKIHPDLNVISKVWHTPLTENVHAFKFEFTKPYIKGNNVFHIYLKADGDDKTGRKDGGRSEGVDYMLTFLNGDVNHHSNSWRSYDKDGKTSGVKYTLLVMDRMVYLSANMSLLQKDDSSVFEYMISSYTRDDKNKSVGSAGLGYIKATSEKATKILDIEKETFLKNKELLRVNGNIPGWTLYRYRSNAAINFDNKEVLVVEGMYHMDKFYQSISLPSGFYLFRALVKTNTHQTHLAANNGQYKIPVGVSEDYKWAELPFCVTNSGKATRATDVGFSYLGYPPTKHPATIYLKQVELIRLGDTVLNDNWVAKTPVHPLHNMELINKYPNWDRPGKVVFKDSFIGTEIWMITQAGQVDHSYCGTPDFSHKGKYIYTGWMKTPRGLISTDGSARYMNDRWKPLVWLFPWEQKYIPQNTNPEDWICTNRTLSAIVLENVVTGKTVKINMPSRQGWKIIENPCTGSSRGPNVKDIVHNTIIWHSNDKTQLGLSDIKGENFRTFKFKSISKKPENDTIYPKGPSGVDGMPISSVWGKSWNNWRNAVDKDGNRYFLFDMNRNNFFDDPENPYQVWAISLTESDKRGLLRVVPNPKVTITEHVSTHSGGTFQPSYNWWELAAGLPRSGDNAILLLEDGTLLHMSALGMHSSFRNTISVNDPYTGEVTFIGNNLELDRISWPHEFRRDKGFATVEGYAEPVSPFLMIDLENKTYWTAVFTNFHDYNIRYRTRRDKTAYHKPMFRTSSTPSPDFTKVVFFSPLLTGDHPNRVWADLYVAVVRYPMPPENVKIKNNNIVWDKPRYCEEIEGYNLYSSNDSGGKYEKVNKELIKNLSYPLPDNNKYFLLTSVEYSGLESRMFSNEVSNNKSSLFRHFYQAETGKLKEPLVPFFEPKKASNSYAVAITDPELIYKKKLQEGLTGSLQLNIVVPNITNFKVMARVRGMSDIERQTYTTGWAIGSPVSSGTFKVKINGKVVGNISVKGKDWQWVSMDNQILRQPAGEATLEFETSDAGISIDNILVTNDLNFIPSNPDNTPSTKPSIPENIKVEHLIADKNEAPLAWQGYKVKPPYIKILWAPSTAPQGVRYYNIHRSDKKDFQVDQSNLLGSNKDTLFIDPELEIGKEYHYKVVAVDSWDNVSEPSKTLSVKIK